MKFLITITIVLVTQVFSYGQSADTIIIQDTLLFGNEIDLLKPGFSYSKIKKILGKPNKEESSSLDTGIEGGPRMEWHSWYLTYKNPHVELHMRKVTKFGKSATIKESTLNEISVTEGDFTLNKHKLKLKETSYAYVNGCLYFAKKDNDREIEILTHGQRITFLFDEHSILNEIIIMNEVQMKVFNN